MLVATPEPAAYIGSSRPTRRARVLARSQGSEGEHLRLTVVVHEISTRNCAHRGPTWTWRRARRPRLHVVGRRYTGSAAASSVVSDAKKPGFGQCLADAERLPLVPLSSKGWLVDATAKQPVDRLPGDVA